MNKPEFPALSSLTRRQLIHRLGAAGLAIPLGSALLAACGSDSKQSAATSGTSGSSPAATAGSTGSTAVASGDTKKGKVLTSLPTTDNIYFQSFASGVQQAAAQLGLGAEINSGQGDFNEQLSALENAKAIGATGLVAQVSADTEQAQITRLAQTLGLPLLNNTVQSPWEATPYEVGDMYLAFQALDGITGFKTIAKAAFDKIGGKGNVLYISGIPGNTADTNRTSGFNEALKEYPDIKLLEEKSGLWNRVDARPIIDSLLNKYSDVQAIICSNDEEALAAVASLEELNRQAVVTGFDAVPEVLDLIGQGRMFASFAQHPNWVGGMSLVRVFDALNGWKPTPLERMMYVGGFVLDTPESAKAYGIMYGDESIYDFKLMSQTQSPSNWDPQNALAPIDLERLWSATPKPSGYAFPPAYATAWASDRDKITAMYKDHFKTDPLEPIRKLTSSGGQISLTI